MSTTTEGDDALAFLRDVQPLHRRRERWCTPTLELGLRLLELTVFFLVGVAAAACLPSPLGRIAPVSGLLAACVATVAATEIGRHWREIGPRAATLVLQIMVSCATGTLVLFVAGERWRADLGWGAGELIGTAVLLSSIHLLHRDWVKNLLEAGRLATHVAVVGTGTVAKRLEAELESGNKLAVKVVGCYGAADENADGDGARGSLRTLLADCRLEFVDAIVLAPEPGDREALAALQRSLRACTQPVYLAPELSGELGAPAPGMLRKLGRSEMLLLSGPPMGGGAALAKRAFDIVAALALVAFMAPLLAVLAVMIVVDSRGPILFRQLRVGYNNQLFYILKFRSMRVDATDRLAKQQTIRGDKRITRVGRVIRRLSLDELPQLLNVLLGEMSLVGPRPHAPGTSIGGQRVHTVVDDYARRHLVRPGITGLAQVRGLRGGLHDRRQVADRLAADLEYIERWSIWLDIRILLGTVLLEMRKSRGI